MITALVFLAGILVLPVGFCLTVITIRLLDKVLGKIALTKFKKRAEIDPWAIANVASHFAASTTGFVSLKFVGWEMTIIPPVKSSMRQQDKKLKHHIWKAVLNGLEEAGHHAKSDDY